VLRRTVTTVGIIGITDARSIVLTWLWKARQLYKHNWLQHNRPDGFDTSGGFRLGPGGHRPPKSCPGPQIFDWFRSALFLLEGFWGPEICLECVGGRGLALEPAGGAHDAPPDPLVAWGAGHPSQEPHASRRLDPRAFSVQRSLLVATFIAYTHLNFWQYTTDWFYSNFAEPWLPPKWWGDRPPKYFFLEQPLFDTVLHNSRVIFFKMPEYLQITSVFENTYFTGFFFRFQKHDILRFFEMSFQENVKSHKKYQVC